MNDRIYKIRNDARQMMRLSKNRQAYSVIGSIEIIASLFGWYVDRAKDYHVHFALRYRGINNDVSVVTPWSELPDELINDIEAAGWLPYGERVSPLELLGRAHGN